MSILVVENIVKKFGGITAVNNIFLEVKKGEILGIIGPNGSGKTTLINLINGVIKPDRGRIIFENQEITNLKPSRRATLGIARTFQITKVFGDMTLMENMLTTSSWRKPSDKNKISEKAIELLRFVGLEDKMDENAANLSGGQKKLLEFARALMLDPKLMLLDEPFAGVHISIVMKLSKLIEEMKRGNKAFIIVSHDIHTISRLCDRVIVMNEGQKIAEGKPEEIRMDEEVIRIYLGE